MKLRKSVVAVPCRDLADRTGAQGFGPGGGELSTTSKAGKNSSPLQKARCRAIPRGSLVAQKTSASGQVRRKLASAQLTPGDAHPGRTTDRSECWRPPVPIAL
jgi:hypothetical protein